MYACYLTKIVNILNPSNGKKGHSYHTSLMGLMIEKKLSVIFVDRKDGGQNCCRRDGVGNHVKMLAGRHGDIREKDTRRTRRGIGARRQAESKPAGDAREVYFYQLVYYFNHSFCFFILNAYLCESFYLSSHSRRFHDCPTKPDSNVSHNKCSLLTPYF